MKYLSVLIKPASSLCNMRCRYCFYRAIAEERTTSSYGIMPGEVLEATIRQVFEEAEESCAFGFQGGEPTLAGLDFFQKAIELQKRYNKKNITVVNYFQTNGLEINDHWAHFFAENKFLLGISLDGPSDLHNLNRLSFDRTGTYGRIIKNIEMLKKYGVEFNLLTVVTGYTSRKITKIYHCLSKISSYLQFIPCLDSLSKNPDITEFSMNTESFFRYYLQLFDLWYADLKKGKYVSIRHIDNLMGMLVGRSPECCALQGQCSLQMVVESDGGVYPCDFYVYDKWRMGNVSECSFQEMASSKIAKEFIADSYLLPKECERCPIYGLCRNGCKRERDINGKYMYCSSFKQFCMERWQELLDAASLWCNH